MRGRISVFGILIGMMLGLVLLVTAANEVAGQQLQRRSAEAPYYLDLNLLGASPVGEFGQTVGGGFGGQLGFRVRLGDRSPLLLRVDAGGMIYGHERFGVCVATCFVAADVTTTNTVGYLGVGPELAAPGRVSPYVFGTVGFSYFSTQSSLDDNFSGRNVFNTRHYADLVAAGRVGGGMRFGLGRSGRVLLDLGVEYHRNGEAEYLREGDIVENFDGSLTLFPTQSEANYLTYRLGVSIPLGGSGDDRGYDHRRGKDWR